MKIRMLSTQDGSVNGITVTTYEQGNTYDLMDTPGELSLAKAFVEAGMAEDVSNAPDNPAPPPPRSKAKRGAATE